MDVSEIVEEATSDEERKSRLNTWVAVAVVIIAAFGAVSQVKSGNLAQAMMKVKSDEVNTWSYFQAKSTKQNLAEFGLDQIRLQRGAAPAAAGSAAAAAKMEAHYAAEVERYEKEKTEIYNKAKGLGEEYEQLNARDDQFDLSDAALGLALALLGITALTQKRWLLWVSLGISLFGFFMGLAGMFAWKIYPAALMQLLS
jgi:hypothetical protein